MKAIGKPTESYIAAWSVQGMEGRDEGYGSTLAGPAPPRNAPGQRAKPRGGQSPGSYRSTTSVCVSVRSPILTVTV